MSIGNAILHDKTARFIKKSYTDEVLRNCPIVEFIKYKLL